jgi:hypothetical protein
LYYYSHKTFKYELCTQKYIQSEHHIQWIPLSDWTILENEYDQKLKRSDLDVIISRISCCHSWRCWSSIVCLLWPVIISVTRGPAAVCSMFSVVVVLHIHFTKHTFCIWRWHCNNKQLSNYLTIKQVHFVYIG